MTTVDLDKAVETVKAIVIQAHQERRLRHLTNRIIRREIEKQLELEDGLLEGNEYKQRLNEAVKEAVDSLGEDKTKKGSSPKKSSKPEAKAKPKERKSDANTKSPSSSKKPDSDVSAAVESPKKVVSPKLTAASDTGKPRKKTKVKVKSEETVEDGDEELSPKKAKIESVSSTSMKKPKKRQVQSDNEVEINGTGTPPKKRSKVKNSASPRKSKEVASVEVKDEVKKDEVLEEKKPELVSLTSSGDTTLVESGDKSESEMSVLIDEEPTKKRKKKVKSEEKRPKPTGKEKKPKEQKATSSKDASPEEEQLKKMKSLVFACGVRKVWSRELKDIESHAKQIAHIRGILTDLGMKGRFSLEQARAIKEKRELQQEIEEVREFAAKHAGEGRPKRAASTSKATVSADTDSEEQSDEEEVTGPSRRKKNARQSIMAFLEDQSDEE